MTQSKIEQLALKKLLPANLFNITAQFGHLLETYPNVPGNSGIYGNYKRNTNKLDVLFPLKEHPVHGITGLHALESYDDAGYVRRYTYSWKIIIPKMGISLHHISAWGNDPHDLPDTPEEFKVITEPHHHHHIPGNRRHRKENWDVHTLEEAFNYVEPYIVNGIEYIGDN
ncbi:DUF6516 family protein [Paenibacillus rhizoplanae]|uniref:DUF6516 family protein n=1 Tax=Paenibacillus rhizoplanae TaxID=1917181 RepID=A0ABW5FF85_9BACL